MWIIKQAHAKQRPMKLIFKRDRKQVVVIDGDVLLLVATRKHEEVGVGFHGRPTDALLLL